MSNLAIRGHLTRGKEVIEILEMLGGKNPEGYVGIDVEEYYIIEEGDITQAYDWNNHITFTLEEFLKEFPYKVGDRVDTTYNNRIYTGEVKAMRWCSEDKCVLYQVDFIHNLRVENILPRNNDVIKEVMEEINIDRIGFNGDKAKLILPDGYEFKTEGKEVYVVKKQPCKEETNMKENTKLNLSAIDYNNGLVGYEIPEGYEFDTVIDNKVVIKKLKPKYPKTYEECCKVLGVEPDNYLSIRNLYCDDGEEDETNYEQDILNIFDSLWKLRICRDAYWKIAGEQMGLGKPWKPEYVEGVVNTYYTIHLFNNKLFLAGTSHRNAILSFPTAEMRDAFYENFKELIEKCKELL